MPEVDVKKGESIDRALKRLKNKLESEGIIEEMRRRRSFETPVQRTKRKARAAAKRGRQRFRFTTEDPNAKEGGEEGSAPATDS
jgi:small subunit ribosomal protein S21